MRSDVKMAEGHLKTPTATSGSISYSTKLCTASGIEELSETSSNLELIEGVAGFGGAADGRLRCVNGDTAESEHSLVCGKRKLPRN